MSCMFRVLFSLLLLVVILLQTSAASVHFPSLPSTSSRVLKSTRSLPEGASVLFQPSSSSSLVSSSSKSCGQKIVEMRGGSDNNDVHDSKQSLSSNLKRNLLGLWGVFQVVSILANAIKRLVPVALQPFQQNDLQPMHWVMYVVWCIIMGYSEGYRAFQLKFSPMVVSRAFDLVNKSSFLNLLLSGPYCMGMFNASRKRMIVSWSITAGVFSLVKLVKFLPYPYRSIVDAGVVVGLSYGTLSIVALTVKALFGGKVVSADGKDE